MVVRLSSPRSRLVLACSLLLLVACAAATVHAQTHPPSNSTEGAPAHEQTEDEKQLEEAENVAAHPFLEVYGLLNGSWIKFFVIVVAASRLALVFPRIGMPLITGYMVIGCLCGPYVLGLVSKPQIPDLSYVTQTALAFIAFSAGSELYLPELRSLFRTIILITGLNALFSYIFCTLFIYLIAAAGLVPWMEPYLGGCAFSISLVAGSIMVARSPASAIAVVRELRAKGPVTSIMLGVTVVGDVVVLILFALSNSFALALCNGGSFSIGGLFITLFTLCCAVVLGYGLGFILIFLLWVPRVPARFTILPLGFFIFLICDWVVEWTNEHWGVALNFDALLICITAGYVIFMPFFTLVGVQLNLPILAQSIVFGVLVFLMRAVCIMCGSYVGGGLAGLDMDKRKKLWMTMLAQAGVSLGLAAEVAVKFPVWGGAFQTMIVSVVLINQFVGPVLCKVALRQFGEAGQMTDDDEEHGEHGAPKKRKRALLFGVDSTALAAAAKLLKAGWRVSVVDREREGLVMAKALGIDKDDTNSCLDGGDSLVRPSLLEAFTPDKQAAAKAVHVPKSARDWRDDDTSSVVFHDGSGAAGGSGAGRSAASDESSRLHSGAHSDSDAHHVPIVDEHGHPVYSGPREPLLDLVLAAAPHDAVSAQSAVAVYGAALASDLEFTRGGIDACILSLPNDAATYELGVWLVRSRRAGRVLVRMHNPAWSEVYRQQGLLPVSELATVSTLLSASATSAGNLALVPASLPLPAALHSLLHPTSDAAHIRLPMSGAERIEFDEQHPEPTRDVMALIMSRLLASGLTAAELSGVRAAGEESDGSKSRLAYLEQMHKIDDVYQMTAEEHAINDSIGMSVSSHSINDERRRAAAREEANEQKEHTRHTDNLQLGH